MVVISRQLGISYLGLVWCSSLPHIYYVYFSAASCIKAQFSSLHGSTTFHIPTINSSSFTSTDTSAKMEYGQSLSVLGAVFMCSILQQGIRKQFYSFTPSCKHHKWTYLIKCSSLSRFFKPTTPTLQNASLQQIQHFKTSEFSRNGSCFHQLNNNVTW